MYPFFGKAAKSLDNEKSINYARCNDLLRIDASRFCVLKPKNLVLVLRENPNLSYKRVKFFSDRLVTPTDFWSHLYCRIVGFQKRFSQPENTKGNSDRL